MGAAVEQTGLAHHSREYRSLLLFLILMCGFRSAWADWVYVPTGSMNPTILEGDRLLVDKHVYGLRVPFSLVHLTAGEDPARGDWPPHFNANRRVAYDLKQIRHWMEVFLTRFFAFSQFKRSAMPNGPKVSAGGSLSPRGDWRAPSDGNAAAWLAELERNVPLE